VPLCRWIEANVSALDMYQGTKNSYHIHMFIVMSGKCTGKEFTCFTDGVICNYFVLVFCI
jgi:hypothetical protein